MSSFKNNFPFSDKGFWHSGIHLKGNGEELFSCNIPGKILAQRNEPSTIYPDVDELSQISKDDIEEELCKTALFSKVEICNTGYLSFRNLTVEEKQELFGKLGISMDSSYAILKHEIRTGKSVFNFFTLYMHLKNSKIDKSNTFLFPSDFLGKYGNSQDEKTIIHAEVFTNKALSISVNKELLCNELQDYYTFPNDILVYFLKKQKPIHVLELPTYTVLNIQEQPEEFQNSLKVNIDRVTARIDFQFLAVKKLKYKTYELKNKKNRIIDIKPYIETLKDTDDISIKKKIERSQDIIIQVIFSCKKNDKRDEIKKEVRIKDITCFELSGKLSLESYCLIPFSFVQSDFDSFYGSNYWIKTDNNQVKQGPQYEQKNRYIDCIALVRNINLKNTVFTKLDVYNYPPNKKIIESTTLKNFGKERFYASGVKKITALEVENNSFTDKCLYNLSNNENSIYIDSFSNVSGNEWKNLKDNTTTFTLDKLKNIMADSPNVFFRDVKKMFESLEMKFKDADDIKSFYDLNKEFFFKCGFQFDSDWIQKRERQKEKYFPYIQNLWDKIYIWNKNYKNEKLSSEIKCCNSFTFYNYNYFLGQIKKIHMGYASKLKKVQDKIMADWRMFQGNRGVYNNYETDIQTFCNQAVFETIKVVDGNYTNFTRRGKNVFPEFDNKRPEEYTKTNSYKNYKAEHKMEISTRFPFTEQLKFYAAKYNYQYKKSNYWCDILELQSEKSTITGICKITAKQAFYMAQLGYVVIAAWKNITPKGSPHFVTVRPYEGVYPGLDSVVVSHVGSGKNEERVLSSAFLGTGNEDKKYKEVFFYCNIEQNFI